jgi:hypothetical protein
LSVRRLAVTLLLGLTGYVLFAFLFPRYTDGVHWNIALDRAESIARARAIGLEHGVDTRGWTVYCDIEVDRGLSRSEHPEKSTHSAGVRVAFLNPKLNEEAFGVRLEGNGALTAVILRAPVSAADDTTVDAARPVAEAAFARLVPNASDYRKTGEEDLRERGVSFRWEAPARGETPLRNASAIVAGTKVRELRYDFIQPKAENDPSDIPDIISDVGLIAAVFVGLALFVIGSVRRVIPQRLSISLGIFLSALFLVEMFDAMPQEARALFTTDQGPSRSLMLFAIAVVAIPIALSASGGYPHLARALPAQLAAFEALFLRGAVRSRSVAAAILSGLAAGGWIAASPHIVRASGLFGTYRVSDSLFEPLLRSAFLPLNVFGELLTPLVAFAAIVPLVRNRLRGRAGSVSAFALAFVLIADPAPPLAATLASGFVATLVYTFVFYRAGLLAVMAAAMSTAWALIAGSRIVQPAAAIQHEGWTAVLLAAALSAVCILVGLRGTTVVHAPWQPRVARAERETMQSEFEFARHAQERMLPDAAPALPGISIATLCRPARQVGGDLYDFVKLAEGCAGIAIADVSGKGVPAALVMTITKGLLLAASDDQTDPLMTLAGVNAGIHSLRNRGVFVTMTYGVLDPRERTFEFVRAGHTPLVWRRAGGEIISLSPRGVGLGMTPARVFPGLCEKKTIHFEEGDFLFLYSDGVTEAMNERVEEFGDERLIAAVRDGVSASMSAEQAKAVLVDAVAAFCGSAPVHDDMTLVVIRC